MSVTYDPLLVVLSILFAIAASYTTLDLAGRVAASIGGARLMWLLAGSVAMGTGIWSMHFIGMMAMHLPVPIGFHIREVLLSSVVAMFASLCALHISSRSTLSVRSMLAGGLFMGPAIAGMHYIGMEALHIDADMHYDAALVALSVGIAIAASVAALWLAHRFRNEQIPQSELAKVGSALLLGGAIAGMHFTGTAAAEFSTSTNLFVAHGDPLIHEAGLSAAVAISAFILLAIAGFAAAVHRRFTLRLLEASRATEAVVRSHEQFLRQVIDANPSLVFVKDWEGRFVLGNKALADAYGSTPEQLVGRTDADFNKQADEVQRFLEDDREVMTGQVLKRISEEPVTNSVGHTRWFQTVKVPLARPVGASLQVLGVATDITDRKLLEDQLRHAQKMEALGQLTGGIAHDLNNVLTVILANTDLISPHLAQADADITRDFKDLQGAASRGADMVRKLLAFSRRETLRMKPLDLTRFCNELLNTVQRLLPATIDVRLHTEPVLPHVTADEGAVHQMMLNLVTNARDAMPDGGMLVIDVAHRIVDEEWCITHGWGKPGKYVCVTVSDTGTGMDAATREKVFEPFFTTKAQGEGTGLGLPMVYGLIRQHDGFIGVYSEVSQGTAIRLYFPATVETTLIPDVVHARPMRGGTETVLIADDEESIRRSTTRVLERHGYNVITASNGEEALHIISERGEEIHLVISDVVMPKMGGKELLTALLHGGYSIPFLFTSGYAAREVRESVELDASIPFLHKPWAMSDLLQKVREVIEESTVPV